MGRFSRKIISKSKWLTVRIMKCYSALFVSISKQIGGVMKDSHLVAHHIRLLNGRIFKVTEPRSWKLFIRSEQGRILAVWNSETGLRSFATDVRLHDWAC